MVIVNMMIGLITPPAGMLLYVTNALTGVPINAMLREGWQFLLMQLALLLAMTPWSQIVLWLPQTMGHGVKCSGMRVGGAGRATIAVRHAFPEDHHADPG